MMGDLGPFNNWAYNLCTILNLMQNIVYTVLRHILMKFLWVRVHPQNYHVAEMYLVYT